MATPCLRREQPLEEQQEDTIFARFRRRCKGLLLSQPDMVRLLDRSWRAVPEKDAREQTFHASDATQKELVFGCPDCHQPMEKYGSMGWSAIPIDRCHRCNLVWFDAEEVQNMVLAFAKHNYRAAKRHTDEQKRLDRPFRGGLAADRDLVV